MTQVSTYKVIFVGVKSLLLWLKSVCNGVWVQEKEPNPGENVISHRILKIPAFYDFLTLFMYFVTWFSMI